MITENSNPVEYILIDEEFHNTGEVIFRGENLSEVLAWSAFWERDLGVKTFLSMNSEITEREII